MSNNPCPQPTEPELISNTGQPWHFDFGIIDINTAPYLPPIRDTDETEESAE